MSKNSSPIYITVCQGSSDPFYLAIAFYIKWVTTSRTDINTIIAACKSYNEFERKTINIHLLRRT